MKPVLYNDVLAAVSVVAAAPASERTAVMARLLDEAESAARHAALYRMAHPVFGDGSLMAAALRHQRRGDASFQTQTGLDAWRCVIAALAASSHQPEAHPMQRSAVGSSIRRLQAISSPQSSQ